MLFLAIAMSCSVIAFAQSPAVTEKKGEPTKGKDEIAKGKPKDTAKRIPLEKLLTPSGAIIVIVDELREAMAMIPDGVLLTPEAHLKLIERLKALERQLANDKASPSSCKLVGKLDGDFLLFTAEFGFATLQPKATVLLGLKGGHLTDEGSLDGHAPNLEFTDDGYLLRVEKEGPHRLVLNLRVAAPIMKTSGNALERAVKLEMPGAAATLLTLELPKNIDELTLNETLEKTKTPGRWDLGLGAIKSLALSWKEPTPNVANTPLAKVDGQIIARVEESAVHIAAELFLEDLRPLSKEWVLLLPSQAKITEVKGPNGLPREWKNPVGGSQYYRIPDGAPGKWQVSITQRAPRPTTPGARVSIGPFHVLGAFQHLGTITVQMPTEVSFGQRLAFTRFGRTEQTKSTETDTVFQYAMPIVTEKMPKAAGLNKAPLELEWRNEKNQLETQVEHALKMKTVGQGWEVEASTRIKATALFGPFNSLDLKLPMPRPRAVSMVGSAAPGLGFPASLPWGGIWRTLGLPFELVQAEDLAIFDENANPLKLMPQDATGKVRVITDRAPGKQLTVIVKNTFLISASHQRVRLELPRPLNTNDRRAKLTIETDERVELLHGQAGAEEPVPDRHHFDLNWEQSPGHVELAWRPYKRELVAQSTVDITLFEHSAQVKQFLHFPRETSTIAGVDPKQQQIRLSIPRGVSNVSVLAGGEITSPRIPLGKGGVAWLHASADGHEPIEVVLQYDVALSNPSAKPDNGEPRLLNVTPIWPAYVAQKDVKVRVWASPSAVPRLPTTGMSAGWKERSIELVPGKDQFPALVLQGYGSNLPLLLRIEGAGARSLAAFIADRALMEVRTMDDESQQVRARYWLRKMHSPTIELALPLPLSRFREPPTFRIGNKVLVAERKDATERIVVLRVPTELVQLPAILDIAYTVPAESLEHNMPWRTTLLVPVFQNEIVIGQKRWQFDAPGPLLAFSMSRKARPDWHWGLQSWLLTPESAATSADLDGWLLGKESTEVPDTVTYTFALISEQPETVYHLPRHWWLLLCSGAFLIVTLGGYFSPITRLTYWLMLFALGLGGLVLGILCPAFLPPLLFGLQPGVVLFIAFVSVHWLIQERYRRQVEFLPGFVRPKTGSTMMRSNSSKRPREVSTVDAPADAAPAANAEDAPETSAARSGLHSTE